MQFGWIASIFIQLIREKKSSHLRFWLLSCFYSKCLFFFSENSLNANFKNWCSFFLLLFLYWVCCENRIFLIFLVILSLDSLSKISFNKIFFRFKLHVLKRQMLFYCQISFQRDKYISSDYTLCSNAVLSILNIVLNVAPFFIFYINVILILWHISIHIK